MLPSFSPVSCGYFIGKKKQQQKKKQKKEHKNARTIRGGDSKFAPFHFAAGTTSCWWQKRSRRRITWNGTNFIFSKTQTACCLKMLGKVITVLTEEWEVILHHRARVSFQVRINRVEDQNLNSQSRTQWFHQARPHQSCLVWTPWWEVFNVFAVFFRIGLVESKIRKLVESLERNPFIDIAHVNPGSFGLLDERYQYGIIKSSSSQLVLGCFVSGIEFGLSAILHSFAYITIHFLPFPTTLSHIHLLLARNAIGISCFKLSHFVAAKVRTFPNGSSGWSSSRLRMST